MLWSWASNSVPVHVASTAAERDAIRRFLYEVYVEEKGWSFGDPDHERRMLIDPVDEAPFARYLYVGEPDDIRAVARVLAWQPGQVPHAYFEEYAMDRFPNIAALGTSEVGRFAIRSGFRGKLVLPALAVAIYDLLAREGVDLCFNRCRPTLLPYYRRLGARPYGAPLDVTAAGVGIPLVSVLSDYEHFRAVGAVTASRVRHHYGRGGRRPLDQRPFAHLFAEGEASLTTDSGRIYAELRERIAEAGDEAPPWISQLPPKVLEKLAASGFIFTVDAGRTIVNEGMAEREVYVLLAGSVEVVSGSRRVATLGGGEVFGEMAFFRDSGVRTASVRALEPCRVFVLRYKFLEELKKRQPDAAFSIIMNLGAVLSDRLRAAGRDGS